MEKGMATPVFLPGEFHGLRCLAGCSPQGHKELDRKDLHHERHQTDDEGLQVKHCFSRRII